MHLTETAQALPRSDALRQEAWRWLQEQRIVRPGRTTLRDLFTAAREGALQYAFALLARGLTPEQREQLDALPVVPSGGDAEREAGVVTEFWSRSGLEQYKTLARKESPEALLSLLDRLTAILERGLATLPAIEAIHPPAFGQHKWANARGRQMARRERPRSFVAIQSLTKV